MTRMGIGLAAVLWLGTFAFGADEPNPPQPNQAQPQRRAPGVPSASVSAPAAGIGERGWPPAPTPAAPVVLPKAEAVSVVLDKDGERHHVRTVIRLNAVPAVDLANTINSLLRAEGQAAHDSALPSVVIVPDMASNSLVVGGSREAVELVRELAGQLDHAAAMIRLEVVMGEVPTAKAEAGVEEVRKQMDVLAQAELVTLNNQPAFVQLGGRERHLMNVTISDKGRTSSTTLLDVGMIVKATPRVGGDGTVTVQLDIVDSRQGPMEEGMSIFAPAQGEPVRSPNLENHEVNTALHLRDGQTMAVAGMSRAPKADKRCVVLVTAHVLTMGGEAKGVK